MDIKEINEKIQRESAFVDLLTMELSKVTALWAVGQSANDDLLNQRSH